MRNPLAILILVCYVIPMFSLAAESESLVVFVPQAKLREEPNFQAKVVATIPDGDTVVTTGKSFRAKSGPDHFGIINESWVQVEHDGELLWVPRRDCLKPAQYQLISAAHRAGITGDTKGMLAALGSATMLVISPDGENAFAAYDPHLFGVFRSGRGLVEWFGVDDMQNARWSTDSRFVVLEAVYGPRNVYDMQMESAVYAGDYLYLYRQFSEEFVPGYYLYTEPGSEMRNLKGDKAYEIYYEPTVWVVNLDSGEFFLLLEGKKGSQQMHGGAWSMEMECKAKDVPEAVKTSELWQKHNGGLMVCPMMMDQGG